jgi:hypothetical protein
MSLAGEALRSAPRWRRFLGRRDDKPPHEVVLEGVA